MVHLLLITGAIVLLKADIRRASGALHSAMAVIFFCCLAVNAVCPEHGI